MQLVAAPFREDLLLRRRRAARSGAAVGRPPPAGPRLTAIGDAVTVAGGQGFYGDTPAAVDALLAEGVDYLCLEALAELTLAILQKDRQRDETRGYTRDLPAYLARALPFVADGRTKVITNAGGINPAAAARAAIETARATRRHRHQDRDRRRRRPARRGSTRCTPSTASRSRTSTPATPFDDVPAPRRCSRPRTSARVRSPTRSRRAPTS